MEKATICRHTEADHRGNTRLIASLDLQNEEGQLKWVYAILQIVIKSERNGLLCRCSKTICNQHNIAAQKFSYKFDVIRWLSDKIGPFNADVHKIIIILCLSWLNNEKMLTSAWIPVPTYFISKIKMWMKPNKTWSLSNQPPLI